MNLGTSYGIKSINDAGLMIFGTGRSEQASFHYDSLQNEIVDPAAISL
jgi:hypothetical protein